MTSNGQTISPHSWARAGVTLLAIPVAAHAMGDATRIADYVAIGAAGAVWDNAQHTVVALVLHLAVAILLWVGSARIAAAIFPHEADTGDDDLERILAVALVVAGVALAVSTLQQFGAGVSEIAVPTLGPAFGAEAISNRRTQGAVKAGGAAITALAGLLLARRSRDIARAIARRGHDRDPWAGSVDEERA